MWRSARAFTAAPDPTSPAWNCGLPCRQGWNAFPTSSLSTRRPSLGRVARSAARAAAWSALLPPESLRTALAVRGARQIGEHRADLEDLRLHDPGDIQQSTDHR